MYNVLKITICASGSQSIVVVKVVSQRHSMAEVNISTFG